MEPMNRAQRRLAKKQGGASPSQAAIAPLFAEALRRHQSGALAEAEPLYRQILTLDPRHADSLHLLGVIAHQIGRREDAVALIERAIRIEGGVAAYHNHLGLALETRGKRTDAARRYGRALALDANFAEAHVNFANLLKDDGKLDDALTHYARALALKPDVAETHYNLGLALRLQGKLDEAFAAFRRHADLKFTGGPGEPNPAPHKQKHDREQRDYLNGLDLDGPIHIEGGARVAAAINPAIDSNAIESDWATARPQVAVVDDLLTPDALDELRRFCWGSNVWRVVYRNGYLGGFPNTGFACPVLAQIAVELGAKLPGIIRHHKLMQCWGFKYDSTLTGINVHADQAAVNVNFWITADEANRDKDSGGLKVWDVPAPLDWDFQKFNNDEGAIRAFLAEKESRAVTVPYRCNRAVIFDSDLFHETDRLDFAEGYRNRRINVTMLFGLREDGAMPSAGE
jgi:Flp pilus assembly protein TadD